MNLILPGLETEGEELGAVEGGFGRIAIRRDAVIDAPDALEITVERKGHAIACFKISPATAIALSCTLQVAAAKLHGKAGA